MGRIVQHRSYEKMGAIHTWKVTEYLTCIEISVAHMWLKYKSPESVRYEDNLVSVTLKLGYGYWLA